MRDSTVRHLGDLGGQLVPGRPTTVIVHMSETSVVADIHTAWMLINLLLRLNDIVSRVILDAPQVIINARISPHVRPGTPFEAAGIELASNLAAVPLTFGRETDQAGIHLHVGPGGAVRDGWRVVGRNWEATVSQAAIDASEVAGALPFGPYAAACLGAGEIFRAVRLPSDKYLPISTITLDTWSGGQARQSGPQVLPDVPLSLGLAGVGAVGAAALQTLWASDGLTGSAVIADNDEAGVDETNLNRYVLFDRRHLGLPKATTAAALYGAGQLTIDPIDGPYDRAHLAGRSPSVLLSAVDTNDARHDLQRGIVPGIAFGGSTQGLRAELVVTGPPDAGPCLACHNNVLTGIPDDITRATVRSMNTADLAKLATTSGTSRHDLEEWAQSGQCGTINPQMIGHALEGDRTEPAWSVGFVSVYAGVMLAAQAVRHALGHNMTPASSSTQFQFRLPQAEDNGAPQVYLRDPGCVICSNEIHRLIWAKHHLNIHDI